MVLVDPGADLELVGIDVTLENNFGSNDVVCVEEALAFAERVSFPSHDVIVMPYREGCAVVASVVKGIVDAGALEQAVLGTHARIADARRRGPASMC